MANLLHFFPDRVFYLTITDPNFGNLKSLHTLFDKYIVKFDQNRTVRNIQNFEIFGEKWLTILEKVLTPFLKYVSLTKTVV